MVKNLVFIHGMNSNWQNGENIQKWCCENDVLFWGFDLPLFSLNDVHSNLEFLTQFCIDKIASLELKGNICIVGHSLGGALALMVQNKTNIGEKLILIDPFNPSILKRTINVDSFLTRMGIRGEEFKGESDIKKHINKRIIDIKNNVNPELKFLMNITKNESLINLLDEYKNIKILTLVLFGEHDRIIFPEDSKKCITTLSDNYLFEIIKESGHSPHKVNPTDTIKAISKYLKLAC